MEGRALVSVVGSHEGNEPQEGEARFFFFFQFLTAEEVWVSHCKRKEGIDSGVGC